MSEKCKESCIHKEVTMNEEPCAICSLNEKAVEPSGNHYDVEKFHLFMDGNQWCVTDESFTNLQESVAGFGDTPNDAMADYRKNQKKEEKK